MKAVEIVVEVLLDSNKNPLPIHFPNSDAVSSTTFSGMAPSVSSFAISSLQISGPAPPSQKPWKSDG
jgi:hypothetical protein